MILILAETIDKSVNDVIDWLTYFKLPFLRINESEFIQSIRIESRSHDWSIKLELEGKKLDLDDVKAYWYRRGDLKMAVKVAAGGEPVLLEQLHFHIQDEWAKLREFLFARLADIPSIGNGLIEVNAANKLKNLQLAKTCGLDIPKTYIFSKKKHLQALQETGESYILKGISEIISMNWKEGGNTYYQASSHTVGIDEGLSLEVGDHFFPSCIQEKIEKEYELRVFFLCNELFAMAIFSQLSEATQTDNRMEAYEGQNRCTLYKLPDTISEKITRFMKVLGLNCGSIDLIKSVDGRYIFLEVNPVGQFNYVSENCNYQLEFQVAKTLKDFS
ncbi:MAG: grasp-with-spasm system ATP-grasp peptide maturase [Bacteroidia bacterium]|nr:grasp-with-spasm system ATP-grasp peptide maturase [Bacteroidia bacterium]